MQTLEQPSRMERQFERFERDSMQHGYRLEDHTLPPDEYRFDLDDDFMLPVFRRQRFGLPHRSNSASKGKGDAGKGKGDADSSHLLTTIKPPEDNKFPVDLNRGWRKLPRSEKEKEKEDDGTVLVCTADLNAALDILTRRGRLIICGPPGSGKTRLADAVQKVFFKERGFAIETTITFVQTCHSHPNFRKNPGGATRTLVVEDDQLGKLRCRRSTYHGYLDFLLNTQELWDRPAPDTDAYSAFLVVTCHPHILEEIQMLDEGAPVPLADPEVVYRMTRDPIHPALPFKPDLRRYVNFLVDMMREDKGRLVTCAVLALALEGWNHAEFLLDPRGLHEELESLGMTGLTPPQLAEMAHFLQGFILAEDGVGFVNRFMYDAVGLGLGIGYSVHMVLLKCDVRFLAQYVRMDRFARPIYPYRFERIDPQAKLENIHLGVPDDSSFPRHLFWEKMYQALGEKALVMEMCQHPSLVVQDTVEELAEYCAQKKNYTERVMRAVDAEHKLPMLYWSTWNSCGHLNYWCMDSMQEDIRKNRVLNEPLFISVLASVLLSEAGDRTLEISSHLVKDLAHHKIKLNGDGSTLIMPVPTLRMDDVEYRLKQIRNRLRSLLCYLQKVNCPLPVSFVKVILDEDKLTVRVPTKCWYLLLRLISDTHIDEQDEKGDTVLHHAARSGDCDIIRTLVISGASLVVRNKKGMTPPQAGSKRKQQAEKNSPQGREEGGYLHMACLEGDLNAVKVLLCEGWGLEERDGRGNTPLHVACRAGNEDLVVLLLQLQADVSARNVDKHTPAQEASAAGHQSLVKVISKYGSKHHRR